jgi:hypothetical protein
MRAYLLLSGTKRNVMDLSWWAEMGCGTLLRSERR